MKRPTKPHKQQVMYSINILYIIWIYSCYQITVLILVKSEINDVKQKELHPLGDLAPKIKLYPLLCSSLCDISQQTHSEFYEFPTKDQQHGASSNNNLSALDYSRRRRFRPPPVSERPHLYDRCCNILPCRSNIDSLFSQLWIAATDQNKTRWTRCERRPVSKQVRSLHNPCLRRETNWHSSVCINGRGRGRRGGRERSCLPLIIRGPASTVEVCRARVTWSMFGVWVCVCVCGSSQGITAGADDVSYQPQASEQVWGIGL